MNHIVLIFYILMITTAGAGTAAALVLHLRIRRPVTLAVAIVTVLFLIALVLGVISYYLQVVLPPDAYPSVAFTVIGMVLGVAVYSGVAVMLAKIAPEHQAPHAAALILALVAQIGRGAVGMAGATELLERLRLPAIGVISLYLLYAGIVALRRGRHDASPTVASLMVRLGWLLVIFAPISTLFYFFLYRIPPSFRPPVSLDFLFALGWSAVLISAFVRHLNAPEVELEEGLPQGFREAYGITERESDVVALVAQGLSNKEIADSLFVSLTTVRTHLYNVFKKTGAKSRIDLLRIARQYRS
jgi:DNA-binding CsgD family transcriptional regulator